MHHHRTMLVYCIRKLDQTLAFKLIHTRSNSYFSFRLRNYGSQKILSANEETSDDWLTYFYFYTFSVEHLLNIFHFYFISITFILMWILWKVIEDSISIHYIVLSFLIRWFRHTNCVHIKLIFQTFVIQFFFILVKNSANCIFQKDNQEKKTKVFRNFEISIECSEEHSMSYG